MSKNQSISEQKHVETPEDKESFSFKPKIECKVKNIQKYKVIIQILGKIEEREKITCIKMEHEEKEFKDCTFQPKIAEKNESKENMLIPGLDRFLT